MFLAFFAVFQAQEHSHNDPERFRGKRCSPISVDFRLVFRGGRPMFIDFFLNEKLYLDKILLWKHFIIEKIIFLKEIIILIRLVPRAASRNSTTKSVLGVQKGLQGVEFFL